jgi:hypothetical protein
MPDKNIPGACLEFIGTLDRTKTTIDPGKRIFKYAVKEKTRYDAARPALFFLYSLTVFDPIFARGS